MGERVARSSSPTPAFDLDACRAWFAERGVARFKTPERVVVVDALPLLATGQARPRRSYAVRSSQGEVSTPIILKPLITARRVQRARLPVVVPHALVGDVLHEHLRLVEVHEDAPRRRSAARSARRARRRSRSSSSRTCAPCRRCSSRTGDSEMCRNTPGGVDRLQLEVLRDERDRREAARAVRLEAHRLVLERRHVRERDRFARAADERVELVVDVGAHLRRERRERRRLQQVAVLRVLVDGDDDPELELLVRLDDRGAGRARSPRAPRAASGPRPCSHQKSKTKARTCLASSENSKAGTFCGMRRDT